MPSAPKVPQHFRIHGQTDTDSEVDQGDVHMEPASAAPIDNFPPLDAASVAARASRTAYKQQRRQEELFEGGKERLRNFMGNASNRASSRIEPMTPILTHDSRPLPGQPSSSTTPQRSTAPKRSMIQRAAPSPSRVPSVRNVRQRPDIPDADLPENGLGGMERLATINNQSIFAAAILKGKTDLGEFSGGFTDSIRRDLARFSQIRENTFLVAFMAQRSNRIQYPTKEMGYYTADEVMPNAFEEFRLERWHHVRRTSVDWTQYSVAILYLISEASTFFCWTAELLRRAETVGQEQDLMTDQLTYHNLFKYGRSLVYWLRHEREKGHRHGVFIALKIFIRLATLDASSITPITTLVSLRS